MKEIGNFNNKEDKALKKTTLESKSEKVSKQNESILI